MTHPAWYSGDPSVNLEIAAKLDALTPADIGAATAVQSIDAQTASYTLVAADAGKVVTVANASGNTLTIPPNSAVPFPVGTEITVIQTGAGQTTITAGGGVTIHRSALTAKVVAQYGKVKLLKVATDTWQVNGDLAAS